METSAETQTCSPLRPSTTSSTSTHAINAAYDKSQSKGLRDLGKTYTAPQEGLECFSQLYNDRESPVNTAKAINYLEYIYLKITLFY